MKDDLKTRIKKLLGYDLTLCSKVVMYRECFKYIKELEPSELDALEISGHEWQGLVFKSYAQAHYPELDICKDCLPLHKTYPKLPTGGHRRQLTSCFTLVVSALTSPQANTA